MQDNQQEWAARGFERDNFHDWIASNARVLGYVEACVNIIDWIKNLEPVPEEKKDEASS